MVPNYFKKIGLLLMLVCGIIWLVSIISEKPFVGIISTKFTSLLGLLFVFASKEKDENLAINSLRLHSFFGSFVTLFFFISAMSVVNLLMSTDAKTQENLHFHFQKTDFLTFSGILLGTSFINFYSKLKKYRKTI